MAVRTMTVAELAARRHAGIDLIDVRTPGEFRQIHAEEARLVPLGGLDPHAVMRGRDDPSLPLYLICQSGGRSRQAAEVFGQAGFPDVVSVEGGTRAWEAAGLPVVRGPRGMALERQVRIAAGSLVVLGSGLGAFVHPGFIALAGVRRRGPDLCGRDGYLRDGDDPGPDALEPGRTPAGQPRRDAR